MKIGYLKSNKSNNYIKYSILEDTHKGNIKKTVEIILGSKISKENLRLLEIKIVTLENIKELLLDTISMKKKKRLLGNNTLQSRFKTQDTWPIERR
ncbi:MAG: hypothetical protein CSA33_02135 [Desulfobulbus propionicus]|nr:MAG: hypothetical protein CSA33_02135 [Desulfobulbus propionicus]